MAEKSDVQKDNKGSDKRRAPVVAILGHVDHGKTTLLDYIRESKLSEKEAGGITQSIGAYQIKEPTEITFIDTPGHEAFSTMRSRGAKAADITVLVVAADDSVMPQTEESVKYIKKADIPLIVAINKIDLPESKPERVKKDLLRAGVACEGYGGDTVAVEISAKTGKGVDELLEMIGLVGQMKELKYAPEAELAGVVIESGRDKRRGPYATVLVKRGTLKLRDEIAAGGEKARVRALFNDQGEAVKKAGPSEPVLILGFSVPVSVGAVVIGAGKKEIDAQAGKSGVKKGVRTNGEGAIKLVVKADAQGTLESVLENLPTDAAVLRAEVGEIAEDDISYAAATGAAVIGFRVDVSEQLQELARREKIVLRTYEIIYKLLEEIEDVVTELTREPEEIVTGRAKILAQFEIDDLPVAGVRVEEGKFRVGDKVKVEKKEVVSRGEVVSIKQQKVEVSEAKKGEEYGLGVSKGLDFEKGDVIIAYNIT